MQYAIYASILSRKSEIVNIFFSFFPNLREKYSRGNTPDLRPTHKRSTSANMLRTPPRTEAVSERTACKGLRFAPHEGIWGSGRRQRDRTPPHPNGCGGEVDMLFSQTNTRIFDPAIMPCASRSTLRIPESGRSHCVSNALHWRQDRSRLCSCRLCQRRRG